MIKGTGVSAGIASGRAFVLAGTDGMMGLRRTITTEEVEAEVKRLQAALSQAERELLALKTAVGEQLGSGEADLFTAQALVLGSSSFHDDVAVVVREKLVNVEGALSEVIEGFMRAFEKTNDSYLRERAADIRDVGRRVMAALVQGPGDGGPEVPEDAIVVAEELLPSATARLELNRVRAFVTERGGRFSHAAILARSLATPAVAGVADARGAIKTGDRVVVDGVSGLVFVNPEPRVESEYRRLEDEMRAYREGLQHLVEEPSITEDGQPVALLANVNKFADTEAAIMYNAEGIGLYRTEFGYSIRATEPNEDEQLEFWKRAAERIHPRRVVFRLLDIGGDKQLPYVPLPPSRNPSLSERGIRLLLRYPSLLKTQLRAFLRISAEHPVSILIPVVAGVEEVRQTRAALRAAQLELEAEGKPYDPKMPVGAMIEVPAAALIADVLAKEVDFFSLGTNDLVQYVLAADREDEGIVPYYQPLHPSVLRLLRAVVEAADGAKIPLSICGEIAGDPMFTELLIGLGLRAFSVAPGEMLDVKQAIRTTNLADARKLAARALALGSVAEISALIADRRPAGHANPSFSAIEPWI